MHRRPVLVSPIDERLKTVVRLTAGEHDIKVHALDVLPATVHMLVEADPTTHVAEIVSRIKGNCSRILREEFPSLRSRLPCLWSPGYFAATTGHVSAETIARYVAAR